MTDDQITELEADGTGEVTTDDLRTDRRHRH